MSAVVADTHTIIWDLSAPEKLSPNAKAALDDVIQAGDFIYIASISVIEIAYLVEKGRIPKIAFEELLEALVDPDTALMLVPLDLAVAQTIRQIPRDIIPDMPDRIIAATALHLQLPLVTRDQKIQASAVETIW